MPNTFFGQQATRPRRHQIRGEGGRIAPDLLNLVQRDYTSLLKEVMEPSVLSHLRDREINKEVAKG